MILKKHVIEKLSKDLLLPYTGVEQDWELEMADSKRLNEFVNFYKTNNLSDDEKMGLMSLILASYDDSLNEKNLKVDGEWNAIREVLEFEKKFYSDLLNEWGLPGETSYENIFKITPLIRKIQSM
jgi:hypothetical protein